LRLNSEQPEAALDTADDSDQVGCTLQKDHSIENAGLLVPIPGITVFNEGKVGLMGTSGLNGSAKVGYCIDIITGFSLDFEVRFFVTRVHNLFSSLQVFGDHVIQSNRLMFILLSFKPFFTDIGFSYVSDASSNILTRAVADQTSYLLASVASS
jgi:hypothetical protein